MKLDPCTVTFAGVTLTEEPHGISGFSATGQGIVSGRAGVNAPKGKPSHRGNDTMPCAFQVARQFDSPAAAGHFARTHYGALKAATGGAGVLDFVYEGGTDRMEVAALQSATVSGPFDHNRVIVTYTFIGPPIGSVS